MDVEKEFKEMLMEEMQKHRGETPRPTPRKDVSLSRAVLAFAVLAVGAGATLAVGTGAVVLVLWLFGVV